MGRKKVTITNIQIAENLMEGNEGREENGQAGATEPVLENHFLLKEARIKSELFLSVKYKEDLNKNTDVVKRDCGAVIQDDLIAAFAKLDEHWCRASEQYRESGILDTDHCKCSGFIIGGDGISEGVTLIGYRDLEALSEVSFSSPFISWDGDYEFVSELGDAIEDCKHEVKQYLFEGKHKPPVIAQPKKEAKSPNEPELPFDNGYAEEDL